MPVHMQSALEVCKSIVGAAQPSFRARPSQRCTVLLLQGRTGGEGVAGVSAAVVQQVALPLGLAFFIVRAIVANGKRLVNRPQLCPRLAHPWTEDAAVDPGGAQRH